jgi:lipoate-protein ligase B
MNNVLRSYGLDTHIANDIRKDDPDAFKRDRKDVWLEKENVHYKLGGKGIHTSGPVAYHGFNFYVKKGSTFGFKFVNPCGYTNDELKTTSVEEALGKEISMDDFKKSVLYEIKSQFKYDQIIKFGDFSNLV